MTSELYDASAIGSVWNRWDPHIHTPGTILANEYGSTTIEDFCEAVTESSPTIKALGITDYLSIENYLRVIAHKHLLPNVELIFPNVEGRLDVGTQSGRAINVHLLFSPSDPEHPEQIKRFLGSLTFEAGGHTYNCTRKDLIDLGKRSGATESEEVAFREGTSQFKLNLKAISEAYKGNQWAQANMLIAVVASSTDGMAGIQDSSSKQQRQSMESKSHLIFSSNPNDAAFWQGTGKLSPDEVRQTYGSLKACIHGCDAHKLEEVGKPKEDRLCWIKGDLTFDSLKQACIEPTRAYVGPRQPDGANPSQVVASISVKNAEWLQPSDIRLNSGLIAIIGARGSGKTALADLIAAGAQSQPEGLNKKSFVYRAAEYLHDVSVQLVWGNGDTTDCALWHADSTSGANHIQYLSQQFVEALCSSDGLTDSLVNEIRRVIYEAHDDEGREGASDFDELFEIKCRATLDQRRRFEDEIKRLTDELANLEATHQTLETLQKQEVELANQIKKSQQDRNLLAEKGQAARVTRHQTIRDALALRTAAWESETKKSRTLGEIKAEVRDFRERTAQNFISNLQAEKPGSGLAAAEWSSMRPTIATEVDGMLDQKIDAAAKVAASIRGTPPTKHAEMTKPYIEDAADLSQLTISLLEAESNRLTGVIGLDQQKATKFKALTEAIDRLTRQLEAVKLKIKEVEGIPETVKELKASRKAAHRGVFGAFITLEQTLAELYRLVDTNLRDQPGALGKLSFSVQRKVAIDDWVELGESLLDLRIEGPFHGRGALKEASAELAASWQSGDPEKAAEAVHNFIEQYGKDLPKQRLASIPLKEWGHRVMGWLHSTQHISIEYGLQYEGVDVRKLSPGTRGIVLLLLYLAIDKTDNRPLIVDQPEENLDPQSIYSELVERFKEARLRRQIILVTHNANLVVNTDADQVIVAKASAHQEGSLPTMTYEMGGLETELIRTRVCEILEGGEQAFLDRANRLRVKLREGI